MNIHIWVCLFCSNVFVVHQVFNEINSREMDRINVFRGIFDSGIFAAVLVSTVVFQAVIVEFLGAFASTVPLSWQLWLFSIAIGSVSMPVSVLLKCIPVGSVHLLPLPHPHQRNGYQPLPSGPEAV